MTENFYKRSSESPKKIMVLAGGSDQIAGGGITFADASGNGGCYPVSE